MHFWHITKLHFFFPLAERQLMVVYCYYLVTFIVGKNLHKNGWIYNFIEHNQSIGNKMHVNVNITDAF